jgi:hypothetical protein
MLSVCWFVNIESEMGGYCGLSGSEASETEILFVSTKPAKFVALTCNL